MRQWSIPAGGPRALRIAADARVCVPSYLDDQIWELCLEGGDPPGVSVETSYGLRARSMRLFPSFLIDGDVLTHPAAFALPPIVRSFLVNYLRSDFTPARNVDVQAEYWVPDSRSLVGRFLLQNRRASPCPVRLALNAVLRPGNNPQAMGGMTFGGVSALGGRTGNLAPIVFLAGGATVELAPYPALILEFELAPGSTKSITWAHVGLGSHELGFETARALAARPWDAEIARLEHINASLVEIETGDPEWDAALALTQKAALASFVGPTAYLRYASPVDHRLPDRGYSGRGDGRDYTGGWQGQSAFAAYVLLPIVIHAAPELAKGVILNFLASQVADGSVDSGPGLAGQRTGTLCPPLLATMAWRVYEQTEDRTFLERCLPRLVEFNEAWFTPAHDRDQDGHPEWDHTLHAGFDDWPSFVRWRNWGQGLDITLAETPDLASYLVREAKALRDSADELGRTDLAETLEARLAKLGDSVERTWSRATSSYHHQDRDLHTVTRGTYVGKGHGEFVLEMGRVFDPEARLQFCVRGPEGQPHAARVAIHGRGRRGRNRIDRLTERDLQWFWEQGRATTEKAYAAIDRIEVRGLREEFTTEIWTGDFTRQDQSLLLPLWAGIPDQDRTEQIVRRTLTDPQRFWRPYGIPRVMAGDPDYASDPQSAQGSVSMVWNTMLGEALIGEGCLVHAVDLVTRLMDAAIHSLKRDGAFRASYSADAPGAWGERDSIAGLAPLSLFLDALGVQLISPRKVRLSHKNPYARPVIVRWMGLELRCEPQGMAVITFPDGQSVDAMLEEPLIIEQLD
jgi:hypothetical protein